MALSIPMAHVQILTALGLVGVFIGWRGGMQRMSGFYDMPNATKHLAIGIVLGAIFGVFIDEMYVRPVAETGLQGIVWILLFVMLIGFSQSLAIHFLLTRKSVLALRAAPTSGWTLGLGLGSLQVVYVMLRMADPTWYGYVSGMTAPMLAVSLWLVTFIPLCEAILGSWQGAAIVEKRQWGVIWKSGLLRGLILICLTLGITFQPVLLLVLLPAAIYGFDKAGSQWLPAALVPAVKQEYLRTLRAAKRRRKQADNRLRGEIISDESE